ncbi:hypothetical protein L211DRAFT_854106 [Terfezia boudieri ATCC MYA-4762]|uniref:DUF6532 domain-containing protein n=1 Tax=Terfezia boudieri ATCC MYA-4762 TaxID=1051890 RepID=A0A3N4L7A0_9PEZI|nr:hypothetical protein L211DRAFT_854106 [Terfezia boudieri ATCC MYA-4762]
MRGNFDPSFFDSINEVFICLVACAMRHCLKTWSTGVYVEPAKNTDFKYETTVSTWNAYPSNVRKLLLAAIKADLRARLADSQKSGLLESEEPLQINDASAFEAELKKELFQAQQATRDARPCLPDALQPRRDQDQDENYCLNMTNCNSHMEADSSSDQEAPEDEHTDEEQTDHDEDLDA